ncbi:hypothetical protein QOZ89_21590 [Pseudofrankia sp. BMG5.37]|nr:MULTISPECIES: hypothetical protein [unclassified Pseudofrankia]MDT3442171.1 hypothetical protein [Pseudofrankia sp. BMG5.37]
MTTGLVVLAGEITTTATIDYTEIGWFFLRVEFTPPDLERKLVDVECGLTDLAASFGMEWRLRRAAETHHLGIMVSKADHALQELLWRRQAGDLRAEISVAISNHPRGDGALPLGGAGRRADHRAGRVPGRPSPHRHRPARRWPVCRALDTCPCGVLASRRPRYHHAM